MAVIKIEENGFFSCSGTGFCGGTDFQGRESVIKCFNCNDCRSFQKDGLKIIDNREKQSLERWLK